MSTKEYIGRSDSNIPTGTNEPVCKEEDEEAEEEERRRRWRKGGGGFVNIGWLWHVLNWFGDLAVVCLLPVICLLPS